jgi:hypothetical protein
MDEWRDVVGYEGLYAISDAGAVWSVRADRLMRPGASRGYRRVHLCRDGIRRRFLVHVLVADAFFGPCPQGHERNHKNGNRADNRVENLEYVTRRENNLHAYRTLKRPTQQGSKHGRSKLIEAQVIEIRAQRRAGKSLLAIAGRYGVSAPTVSEIANGRIWRHVSHTPAPRIRSKGEALWAS